MGLDISYYERLVPVDCTATDYCEEDDHVRLYPNDSFPGRAEPWEERCYRALGAIGSFCAGGYIGYSMWREALAKLAGYPAADRGSSMAQMPHSQHVWNGATGPFAELINFSDCAGVIGSVVARKLAADFAEFDERARVAFDDYGYRKYSEWRRAFETAALGGAVEFH